VRSVTCSAGASSFGRSSPERSPLMRSVALRSASCGPCTEVSDTWTLALQWFLGTVSAINYLFLTVDSGISAVLVI